MHMFVDMNSYFATCEQQVSYYLRHRPVAVCVYTGQFGSVIAASIEAKQKGVKTGMRLNEAMQICPELVPLETNAQRYREFHIKIMKVLKKYCQNVVPKSIDEAYIDLKSYLKIYPDLSVLANNIKADIRAEVGDWMKCSIGIAPNIFLAKLASNMQKPDGLTIISLQNLDEKLAKLTLVDLPGIGHGMATRLERHNILSPTQLRHASIDKLRLACGGIVGEFWHRKMNGLDAEHDIEDSYKSMGAMRMLSQEQRSSPEKLNDVLSTLCITLEKRMVKRDVFCKEVIIALKYADNYKWQHRIKTGRPLQSGIDMKHLIEKVLLTYAKVYRVENMLNHNVVRLSITLGSFSENQTMQEELFGNLNKKDRLRKLLYKIKDTHGSDKIMYADELMDEAVYKDIIGFGSIKDLYQ